MMWITTLLLLLLILFLLSHIYNTVQIQGFLGNICGDAQDCKSCAEKSGCSWCPATNTCLISSEIKASDSQCNQMNTVTSVDACNAKSLSSPTNDILNGNPYTDAGVIDHMYRGRVQNKASPPAVYLSGKADYTPQTIMANLNNLRNDLNLYKQGQHQECRGYHLLDSSVSTDLAQVETDMRIDEIMVILNDLQRKVNEPNSTAGSIKKTIDRIDEKMALLETASKKDTPALTILRSQVEAIHKKLDEHTPILNDLKKRVDKTEKIGTAQTVSMADLQGKMEKLATMDQHNKDINMISQPLTSIQTDLYGTDLKGTTSGIKFQLNQILTKLMAPTVPQVAVPTIQRMMPGGAKPTPVAPMRK